MSEIYRVRESDGVVIIDLISEVDRLSVLSVKHEIRQLLKKKKNKLVINFENVDHINSTIIGTLVTLQHLAREEGGDLKLCRLKENIKRTFDLIGASKIIEIYEREEDATESYS